MCGKGAPLVAVLLEGVELSVCGSCAKFGTVKAKREIPHQRAFSHNNLPEYCLVANYAGLLREAREQRRMTQADFARFLQEKESVVAKWEAGTLRPGIDVAKRLGKVLSLIFITQEEIAAVCGEKKQAQTEALTVGDFIKIRKRP